MTKTDCLLNTASDLNLSSNMQKYTSYWKIIVMPMYGVGTGWTFADFGLWSTVLSQSTYTWILLYGASFIAKRGLSLDTPLKPWTWMSVSLIGCKAPTDNTCFTPSSKLTPGALRNIGSISSSSCIQSHSCPIRHQGAAALITVPRWTLTLSHTHSHTRTYTRTHTLEGCRIFAGNWSALSKTQCWSSWPWRCWFCRCWSE